MSSDIPYGQTDDTDVTKQLAERVKRVEHFAVSVAELLEGIAEVGKEPGAWVERMAEGRRQAKLNRSLLKQIAAERAGVAEDTAKVIAEAEQQKKTAGQMWARAAERERLLEARERALAEREEANRRSPRYPEADPTFIPMAGSGLTRSLPRYPEPPPDPDEPPQAGQTHIVQAGRDGTTLTQTIEAPPAPARVRSGRPRPGAQP